MTFIALAEFEAGTAVGNVVRIESSFDGVSSRLRTPLPSRGHSAARSFSLMLKNDPRGHRVEMAMAL
jgi:hypothetical protein